MRDLGDDVQLPLQATGSGSGNGNGDGHDDHHHQHADGRQSLAWQVNTSAGLAGELISLIQMLTANVVCCSRAVRRLASSKSTSPAAGV